MSVIESVSAPRLPHNGPMDFIYVAGFIQAEFDNLGLEKEFERSLASSNDHGDAALFMPEDVKQTLTDKHWYEDRAYCLYKHLSNPKNRYIARQMKWSLINGYRDEMYRLEPNNQDLNALINALKPNDNNGSNRSDKNANTLTPINVIGAYRQNAQEALPSIQVLKIDMITGAEIVLKIHAQHGGFNDKKIKKVVADMLSLSENNGDTDQDRALNYALRYNLDIYMGAYELIYNHASSHSDREVAQLNNVTVLTEICGERKIAKVIFDFQNVQNSIGQHWYCAIDVTDDYPFLLTKFKRYLPRY